MIFWINKYTTINIWKTIMSACAGKPPSRTVNSQVKSNAPNN